MPEESEFQQLKKQYPGFFKEFPAKLAELAESEKTASQIAEICSKNRIENEETVEGIAYHIVSVLLGRLPLKILPKALVTNLKIDPGLVEKIYLEANRLIFSPVKDDLAKLYGKEAEKEIPTPKPKVRPEEPQKPLRKDSYRELVE